MEAWIVAAAARYLMVMMYRQQLLLLKKKTMLSRKRMLMMENGTDVRIAQAKMSLMDFEGIDDNCLNADRLLEVDSALRGQSECDGVHEVWAVAVLLRLRQQRQRFAFGTVVILETCAFDSAASYCLGARNEIYSRETDKGNSFRLYVSCYVALGAR